jgi:hypothetical protein
MQALYVEASQTFARLATAAGNATLAAKFNAEAVRMAAHVRSGAGTLSLC